jgi:hypothetical protein
VFGAARGPATRQLSLLTPYRDSSSIKSRSWPAPTRPIRIPRSGRLVPARTVCKTSHGAYGAGGSGCAPLDTKDSDFAISPAAGVGGQQELAGGVRAISLALDDAALASSPPERVAASGGPAPQGGQAPQATARRQPFPAHRIGSLFPQLVALLGALGVGLAAVWGKVASWRKATPA